MKICKPWAVAAVYLMQSVNDREHYTKIVDYIFATELTELIEKGARTSHFVTEMLNQKMVNGRAIFSNNGNGYYALNDRDAVLREEDVLDVIECLKEKNVEVNMPTHEVKEENVTQDDPAADNNDEKLSDEARKLSEETRRLSDEARKLSDETMRLSDETLRLSHENKKLREEAKRLEEEKQQLNEKLQSIRQLCGQA